MSNTFKIKSIQSLCMFVLEWLHYIIAWCVSHMFQVMANGETFGRSLILSPHPSTPTVPSKSSRASPNRSQSTPKSSIYRRLSARLSGRRASAAAQSDDEHERRLQLARRRARASRDRPDRPDSPSACPHDQPDGELVRSSIYDTNNKENNDLSHMIHGTIRINAKDKREVFKNKSINVFNLVDCLTEVGSLHSSLTKSLCDLDSKEEPGFLLPISTGGKELQHSTTTISSGKKRSRNSTDSSFQVSPIDANLTQDKCEDSNWKSIKRLKIKDSFKFKHRPTIFKRTKKDSVSKTSGDIAVESVSPDSVKPTDPAGEFIASTSSPIREDDNTSICSINTSKQSGFFDISFASIRSSKTVKSASKLRRSVKSFTASFRSERKKKYEKRPERNTVEVSACHLPSELKYVSTPTKEIDDMNLDISPVQVDTIDSTDNAGPGHSGDVDELDDSATFKTPQSLRPRAHLRHSICGTPDSRVPLLSCAPLPAPRLPADQLPPASTPPIRDARAITQYHGISLPVLTPFNLVLLNNRHAYHAVEHFMVLI